MQKCLLVLLFLASMFIDSANGQSIQHILELQNPPISAIHGNENTLAVGHLGSIHVLNSEGVWTVTDFKTDFPNAHIWALHVISSDFLLASVQSISGVLKSTDGGLNWSKLPYYGGLPRQFAALPNGDIVVNGSGGIYRSTDMGSNWEALVLHVEQPNQTFLAAINDTILVAGATSGFENNSGSLFYSWDGGSTWADSSEATLELGPVKKAAAFSENIVLLRDGSVEHIDPSSKNSILYSSSQADDGFSQFGDVFFASIDGQIMTSDDGAKSWDSIGVSSKLFPNLFALSDSIIFVSNGPNLYKVLLTTSTAIAIPPELDDSFTFEVFPNPTSGIVNILVSDSPKTVIGRLFNHSGQTVIHFKKYDLTDGRISFDTSGFASGAYLLELVIDSKRVTTTIIVL